MYGNTYTYECPTCHSIRTLHCVPEAHKDAAAPMCWECCLGGGVKMVRIASQ